MSFDKALRLTLEAEGGMVYIHHAMEDGGGTFAGIKQHVYDRHCGYKNIPPKPVQSLTWEEVQEFYKDTYWTNPQVDGESLAESMGEPLDAVFMQLCVAVEPEEAIQLLQAALFQPMDGHWNADNDLALGIASEHGTQGFVAEDLLRCQLAYSADHKRVMKVIEWLKANSSFQMPTGPTATPKHGTSSPK